VDALADSCLVLLALLMAGDLVRTLSLGIPLASLAGTGVLRSWGQQLHAVQRCSALQVLPVSIRLGSLLGNLLGCVVLVLFGFNAGGVHPPPKAYLVTSWSNY
jgi:hypothetical protein